MKKLPGRIITFIVTLSCVMLAVSAQAQSPNTYLYIAHAVSGRNVSSTTNPDFPVDIQVDNICMVKGESFGEIRGPFSGVSGAFTFKITMANSGAPCTGTAIFTSMVSFSEGNTYLGIITLDASNSIVGQVYPVDLTSIAAGQSHVMLANATMQDLTASLALSPSGAPAGSQAVPASSVVLALPPSGLFTTRVYLEGTNTLETGPVSVEIEPRNLYIYVLAGSASNNSVQLIGPRVIRNVF